MDGEKATKIERKKISQNWEAHRLQMQLGDTKSKLSNIKRPNFKRRAKDDYSIHLKQVLSSAKDRHAKINNNKQKAPVNDTKNNNAVLTQHIAIDCEMVGIGDNATDSMLARVSMVNKFGDCVYDSFVKPRENVTDYRTPVSGVRKEDLINGKPFEVVQKEVAEIIKGRTIVGHAIRNDLDVLFLSHPSFMIRDTSKYPPFRQLANGRTPSLKTLTKTFLQVNIQGGEHNSVTDARATMQIYCQHSHQWEDWIKTKRQNNKKRKPGIAHNK